MFAFSEFQGFHVGYVICLNHCFVLIYDGYSETSCTFSFQSQTLYITIVPVFQCLSLKQKHNTTCFVQYNSKEYLYLLNLLLHSVSEWWLHEPTFSFSPKSYKCLWRSHGLWQRHRHNTTTTTTTTTTQVDIETLFKNT